MPSFAATNLYALKISLSVTESIKPFDATFAATACCHDAGFPIRIAVAIVSGFLITLFLTIGAAPAA